MNGDDDKTLKRGEFDMPAIMDEKTPILARLNLRDLQKNLNMIKWLANCQPHQSDYTENIINYVDMANLMVDEIIVKNRGELISRRIKERRFDKEAPPIERRDEDRRKQDNGREQKL